LGLHQAGFEPIALIDWDKNCCDNLLANIARGYGGLSNWNVIQTDARMVNYSDFESDVKFLSGGPPCQPFSLGGKHRANRDARDMFPEAVRAVRELKPIGFIFENVKGLLRPSFSPYFRYILLQLTHPELASKSEMEWRGHLKLLEDYNASKHHSGLEYDVVFRLVNAADYGIPQMRYRLIIVGFRKDLNANWSFPQASHFKEALDYAKFGDGSYWEEHKVAKKDRPCAIRKSFDFPYAKQRWRTVRDALSGLGEPQKGVNFGFVNHEYRSGARPYAGHCGSLLDEPSKTIKAGVHGVPGGENMIVLDDGALRYYTVRESARIQTFPDDYHFYSSWSKCMRQIGNAVPVRLSAIIGKSIMEKLKYKIGSS
jgi:DNA (cytosine-5)-methyltransferase 1